MLLTNQMRVQVYNKQDHITTLLHTPDKLTQIYYYIMTEFYTNLKQITFAEIGDFQS